MTRRTCAMAKRERDENRSPWHCAPRAWEKLKPAAREMRRRATPAEEKLWAHLRGHRLQGFGFRRQHALYWFVADFYCPEARLIIELDGAAHDSRKEQDGWRDACLKGLGLKVLRFRNEEVMDSLPHVLQTIGAELKAVPRA